MRRHSAHARRVGLVGRWVKILNNPPPHQMTQTRVVGDGLKALSDPESWRKWLRVAGGGTEGEFCRHHFSLPGGREWRWVISQQYQKSCNATVSATRDAERH